MTNDEAKKFRGTPVELNHLDDPTRFDLKGFIAEVDLNEGMTIVDIKNEKRKLFCLNREEGHPCFTSKEAIILALEQIKKTGRLDCVKYFSDVGYIIPKHGTYQTSCSFK